MPLEDGALYRSIAAGRAAASGARLCGGKRPHTASSCRIRLLAAPLYTRGRAATVSRALARTPGTALAGMKLRPLTKRYSCAILIATTGHRCAISSVG
ncbi:MAG: hypothetical protein IJ191_08960 [Treponema sp.]|nr:hypothetical protein [Treponema sp.]